MLRLSAAFLVLTFARLAGADPSPRECIIANERSIELQNKHQLKSAREQILVCANTSCPKEVRDECERRIGAISAAIPTLILAAKNGDGNDLAAVRVRMNGAQILDHLDGTAMPLDPGSYAFDFETDGKPVIAKTIVLAEGESRREVIVFPNSTSALGMKRRDPTRRAIGIATAGVGLAGIALGAIMGSLAASSWSTSQSACSTTSCSDHAKAVQAHDDATTFATVSTIGFIAGPILVAAGGVLFFTAPWVAQNQSAGVTIGGAF